MVKIVAKAKFRLCLVLAFCVLFGFVNSMVASATAAEIDDSTLEYEEILQDYLNEKWFADVYYSDNRYYAERIIYDIVSRQNDDSVELRTVSGPIAYCTAPVIQQARNNYCGYASMQEVLAAIGVDDDIALASDSEVALESNETMTDDLRKQVTLEMEHQAINANSPSDGAISAVIPYVMNAYLPNKLYACYDTYSMSGFNIGDFEEILYNSLANNRPVVLLVDTGELSYYNNHSYSHFIVIDYIDIANDQVEIVDCFCFYSNGTANTQYLGRYMETLQNAYNSLDRCFVAMSGLG